MSRATPATRFLDAAGAAYRLHTYVYDGEATNIGLHAARALGIAPARLLKTLMLALDAQPVCAVLPVDHELSLKRLAAALEGKHASLLPVSTAERVTGYHVGGISPFGQKKRVRIVVEQRALLQTSIFCNAGQRGLQVEIDPAELVRLLDARVASITTAD